jgi:hypothetical protein
MKARLAIPLLPPPPTFPAEVILPSQVWIHLTEDQQHRLLQEIVLVYQEMIPTLWRSQKSEVTDE